MIYDRVYNVEYEMKYKLFFLEICEVCVLRLWLVFLFIVLIIEF